jgi:hypothetical protein
MNARIPLPPGLPITGFTVRAARAANVREHRLRARDLARPHWGVRVAASPDLTLFDRCRLLASALPAHAFFCGVSAAALWGMPLPLRFVAERQPDLEVGVANPARAIRRQDARGRRLKISPTDVTAWHGVRLTTPARTWCDLALTLSLGELVAAGDALLFHERPVVSRRELLDAVIAHPGRRGRRVLRRALELLSEFSESPKESELRVIVVTSGFPAPEVNPEIFDEVGRFVARVDLLFRNEKSILEYQGDQHRSDIRQWRRDLTRRAELESLGYHYDEAAAGDLDDVARLIRRIERNLRGRGWTGHAISDP